MNAIVNNKIQTMTVMCGLSGVGKSTWAKKIAIRNPDFVLLDIDDFYTKINNRPNDHSNTFKVWIKFFEAIHEVEEAGQNVLIDTNTPNFCAREQFLEWFPKFSNHVLIYLTAPEELRRANNRNRSRIIPEEIMDKMAKAFESPINDQEIAHWDSIWHYHNSNNTDLILLNCFGSVSYTPL